MVGLIVDILMLALNLRCTTLLLIAIFSMKLNSNLGSEITPRLYAYHTFNLQNMWLPRGNIHFSSTYGNLISFNQDSNQVDSLDLVDFVPNKGIWALGQTPIYVPTFKQLLDVNPNKSDVGFLAEGFEFGFKLHYNGAFMLLGVNLGIITTLIKWHLWV